MYIMDTPDEEKSASSATEAKVDVPEATVDMTTSIAYEVMPGT